jgi:hypothetical protein
MGHERRIGADALAPKVDPRQRTPPDAGVASGSRPTARLAIANQLTMLTGVIGPPRADRMTGPVPVVILRQGARAVRRLG